MEVGLDLGHIVLDGDPAPLPKGGHSPQFSVHVCCGQMPGWIKMPLGTKVGLRQAALCYMRTKLPFPKGAHTQFSAHIYCGQTVAHLSYF